MDSIHGFQQYISLSAAQKASKRAGRWGADLVRGHGGNDLDELGEVGLNQGAALGRHHPLCTNSLHHTNPFGSGDKY